MAFRRLNGCHVIAAYILIEIARFLLAFKPSLGGRHAETPSARLIPAAANSSKARASSAPRRRGDPAGRRQRHAGCPAEKLKAASRPAPGRGRDDGAGQRSGESDLERRRLHGRRAQLARHRVMAINCASSYRGLHEAIVNHANNKPEIITCVHEDIAVHMAQGYAKIEGKPMAMACHGVVGLQHATMAMYNAWCDRVPVLVMGGNIMEADKRAPGAEWLHAGVDIGQIVREFTKWDDQPASLQHFAESAVRAYKIATTPPMGPVFHRARCRAAGKPDPRCGGVAHSKIRAGDAAARRFRRDCASGKNAGRGAKPGHRLRPRGAHAGRHGEPRSACRNPAMRRRRQCRADEFPVAASAQSEFPPRHHRPGRRHSCIEMNDLWGTLTHFSDRIVRNRGRLQIRARKSSRSACAISI